MKKESSKQNFLYVLIFIISAFFISFCGYFYYKNFEKRYINEFHNQLSATAKMKVSEISHWKQERFGDASVFYENQNFSMLIKSFYSGYDKKLKDRIYEWLYRIRSAYEYDRVTLYNTDCKELVSAARNDDPSSKEHAREVFLSVNKKQISFIDFFELSDSDNKYVGIYVPILDSEQDNKLLAFLILRINADDYLYPLIQNWPIASRTAETLILNRKGDSVVFLNNVKFNPASALDLKISLQNREVPAVQAVLGNQGIVYGVDYRGVRVMAYITSIPELKWFMVAKIDVEEVYESMQEIVWVLFVLVVSLVLGFGVAVRYLWRKQRIIFYREKYESERNLREKQELYKTLIDHIPQRILFKDVNSKYISCNNSHADKLKTEPELIAGLTDYDFYPPEKAKRYIEEDQNIIKNHELVVLEEKVIENGEEKYFHVIKTPVFDNDILVGILAIFEDITKRRSDENILQKSLEQLKVNQERLETSQSIVHVGSWEFDPATGKTWSSAEGFRLFGIEPREDEELPLDIVEKCVPEFKKLLQTMEGFLRGDNDYDIEYEVYPDNGDPVRIVASTAKLLKNENDEIEKVLGLVQDITEYRLAERKIKESQNLFEAIVNTSPSLLWMTDINKGLSWFNQMWIEFTGRNSEEELGDGWANGIHPEDREYCLRIYNDSFDKREMFSMEYRLKRYDGQYRWILDTGHPRYDADNNFAGYIGSCIDISDRKKMEYLLIESEEKYRLLAETAKDIIMIQDLDGNILYINKAGKRLAGLNDGGYYLKSMDSFVPKKYMPQLKSFLQSRSEGFEGSRTFEVEFKDDTGKNFPVDIISAPIVKDGEIISILSISRDITDRKRAEEELKILNSELEARIKIRTAELEQLNFQLKHQIEERIKIEKITAQYADEVSDLYNNAPCGYHSINEDGVCVRINDTELNWLGYDRTEILNRMKLSEILTEESRNRFVHNFPVFKKSGELSGLELDFIKKDGSILSAVLYATAIKDENGNYVMSRSTIFDISEIKKAREEIQLLNKELMKRASDLEIANKELEAFAYSVSHDLRAPLRTIAGFSKIVLEDSANNLDSESVRHIELVISSAKKMDQLIIDLLSLSKVTRVELQMINIDMKAMVKALYHELTSGDDKSKITFNLEDLPPTSGDPVLLKQVWDNLLSNAIKYTKTKERRIIEVGSRLQDESIVYFIKDNGVGFNPDYKHKLFGVFQRLHNSDEFEGTGVGLAIAHRIIIRHGGKIWADGVLNEGACFYFELPIFKR